MNAPRREGKARFSLNLKQIFCILKEYAADLALHSYSAAGEKQFKRKKFKFSAAEADTSSFILLSCQNWAPTLSNTCVYIL